MSLMRSATIATSLFALAAGTAATGTAQATVRPAGCSDVINIGSPAQVWVNDVYAGEVEQQFNGCNDTSVWAHWQWSSSFKNYYPYASVDVVLADTYGIYAYSHAFSYEASGQNDYSLSENIHVDPPDTWAAAALVTTYTNSSYKTIWVACPGNAVGDFHVYATGGTTGSVQPRYCNS
jgi:hypothetical protein